MCNFGIARSTCTRVTSPLTACGSLTFVQGMWQYGTDQLVGWNEFLYGKAKEDQHAIKTQEVHGHIVTMSQTAQQRV